MAIDERLIKALHIESLRRSDLGAGGAPHELFQASTIEALLDGAYDGDISFRELARHGDLGPGTFDAVDGEMLAIDGEFLRADVDGALHPVDPRRKTPFAVVTFFDPTHEFELAAKLDPKAFLEALDERIGDPRLGHALRIEGRFEGVRARSVPRQRAPARRRAGLGAGRLGAGPARGREPGLSPRLRGAGSAPGSPGRPRTRPGR